jgi:hypothetical protein
METYRKVVILLFVFLAAVDIYFYDTADSIIVLICLACDLFIILTLLSKSYYALNFIYYIIAFWMLFMGVVFMLFL